MKTYKNIQWLLMVLLIMSNLNASAQNAGMAGQTTENFVGPRNGSLVIVGGGKVGEDIWKTFVELAGGKAAHIVIIPTASDDGAIARIREGKSTEIDALKRLGVREIAVLHTRNKDTANSTDFTAPLQNATGIWFVGGRQWRLADAYLDTRSQQQFNKVLERGGVIGGTSAGATIQGSFLLRGDTKTNTILEGDHLSGLDLLHHVAIDQHILRRNRQFDLTGVVKRHPDLLGIGIDESTAIVVHQNTFLVIGRSYVAIYNAARINGQSAQPAPLASTGGPFYFLGPGETFDLQRRTVIKKDKNRSSYTPSETSDSKASSR